jgi:hypothetical protein
MRPYQHSDGGGRLGKYLVEQASEKAEVRLAAVLNAALP